MLVTKSREELKVSPPTSLGELPEEDSAHPRNEISASPLTFPQQDFPISFHTLSKNKLFSPRNGKPPYLGGKIFSFLKSH